MEKETMSQSITSQLPLTQGINLMLGGAMLSGIILIVCVMCYCCHKRAQKHDTQLQMGTNNARRTVFAIEGLEEAYDCEEVVLSDIQMSATESPPPSYDAAIVATRHKDIVIVGGGSGPSMSRNNNLDSELPTYEAALHLAANGHV